ncbi:hypothetical protein GCM10009665_76480 [Kitasatospora nipponensis]|uniref:PAS domain-containing protein n=1 Tax=Kitasatospora nipponensis TaxID=258049 RepID=A0ABN1T805_9ACTN
MSLPRTTLTAPPAPTGPVAGTAEWDLVTDAVYWTAEVYPMLARDPRLGPLTLDQLPSRLVPQDRPALCRMVTEALVHGRPLEGVVRVDRTDRAATSVHCSGRPVLGADGQVISLRLTLRAA